MQPIARTSVIAVLLVTAAVVRQGPTSTEANGVAAISAGKYHTCALTTVGGVECWGSNLYGQLGNGTTVDSSRPVDVTGLTSGIDAVSAGDWHTCALATGGGVTCWGLNLYGQLGNGTTTGPDPCQFGYVCNTTAIDVTGLTSGVAAVAAGGLHTCALTTAGGVKCWGWNRYGQLGDGQACGTNICATAVDVTGLASGVAAVSAGDNHTCAPTTVGGVKCWGRNDYGSLGNGTQTITGCYCISTPVDVSGLTSGSAAVSAGGLHACALTTGGGVRCWGPNYAGQLGDDQACGTNVCATAVDVTGLGSGVAAVSAGDNHTCALTTGGGVKCWGWNYYGQLGDGTFANKTKAVDVTGLTSGVAAVSAGGGHTCALATGGSVKCWGYNSTGQLGDDTRMESAIPVDVFGLREPPDTDGDGCPDGAELQTLGGSELSGGRRDGKNPYDYFNPTGDGENRVDDVLAVVDQYFIDQYDANLDPNPNYTSTTDRTLAGPNLWNTGPPNGLQRVDDILNIVKQYFHDCA